MLENLIDQTSLPNPHPLFVHFPIAFAVSAWVLGVIGMFWRGNEFLRRSAVICWLTASATGLFAWITGKGAVNGLGILDLEREIALGLHASAAGATLGLILITTVAHLAVRWTASHGNHRLRAGLVVAALLLSTAAVGMVGLTSDRGGALVYRHGVGVMHGPRSEAEGSATLRHTVPTKPMPTEDAWLEFPGQKDTWEFDGDLPVVLEVHGRGLIALPGQSADGVVETQLDITGFDGTIALVHGLITLDTWDGFVVEANGGASLMASRAGVRSVMDKTGSGPLSPTVTLTSTSAGGHFKGALDGKVVVHGHGDSTASGRAGLLLEGEGRVRILNFEQR